jgi:hypothetical protein
MSRPQTKKGKNHMANIPTTVKSRDNILAMDVNLFNGREHYPWYDEIYKIFHKEEFSPKYEDLES